MLRKGDKICNDEYEIIKLIHKSYKSKVYKVKDITGKFFSVKFMKKQGNIENEKAVFENVSWYDATKVIKLCNVDIEKGFVVSKWCEGITFDRLLPMISQEEKLKGLLIDILNGMKTLNSFSVAHCDIKPQNILIYENNAYLGDYDLSHVKNTKIPKWYCGTPNYIAPERIKGRFFEDSDDHPGFSDLIMADIWSFGCMVYLALHGRLPFKAGRITKRMRETYDAIITEESDYTIARLLTHIIHERLKIDDHVPKVWKRVLKCCLEKNPNNRPTVDNLIKMLEKI